MAQIFRVFFDINMSNRIDGLYEIALKEGINIAEIDPKSYMVFLNSSLTKLALLVGPKNNKIPGKMIYFKQNNKIDLKTIIKLPKYFDGKELKYDKALEEIFEKLKIIKMYLFIIIMFLSIYSLYRKY
jgi:hypothetical protein